MTSGKNLPILSEMYKADTGKEGLKKDGTASKALVDYIKEKGFKPMVPTVVKHFGTCVIDIEKGTKTPKECYDEAVGKTLEAGSVYISPAERVKRKLKAYEKKYPDIKF